MSPQEFQRIRTKLGFTQGEVAALLGLKSPSVSGRNAVVRYERGFHINGIPGPVARVMEALESGWRPKCPECGKPGARDCCAASPFKVIAQ